MNKTIDLCKEDREYTVTEITPPPLCAAYEHPSKEIAIQEHKSRFSSKLTIGNKPVLSATKVGLYSCVSAPEAMNN